MKVSQFIEWLSRQDQDLEVCIIQVEEGYDGGGDHYYRAESVCFDDPTMQTMITKSTLTLGTE